MPICALVEVHGLVASLWHLSPFGSHIGQWRQSVTVSTNEMVIGYYIIFFSPESVTRGRSKHGEHFILLYWWHFLVYPQTTSCACLQLSFFNFTLTHGSNGLNTECSYTSVMTTHLILSVSSLKWCCIWMKMNLRCTSRYIYKLLVSELFKLVLKWWK